MQLGAYGIHLIACNFQILLSSFSPVSYDGSSLDLIANPSSPDVVPLREQIVLISESNVTITMNDVGSVQSGLTSEATSQLSTSTSSVTTTSTY